MSGPRTPHRLNPGLLPLTNKKQPERSPDLLSGGVQVSVVDYGLGNLYSVVRALGSVGASAKLVSRPDEILDADKLVIPGVGAFGDGMAGLSQRSLVTPIQNFVTTGRPVLGICLGAQLFMEIGREFGVHSGLGLIPGEVGPFNPQTETRPAKIPHVGWSSLSLDLSKSEDGLLSGIDDGEFFYFTHSYVIRPTHEGDVMARTCYAGQDLAAVVHRDNVFGCQFHPEKSGAAGLRILRNFVES